MAIEDKLVCTYKPRKRRWWSNIVAFFISILFLVGAEYANQSSRKAEVFLMVFAAYLIYIYTVPWLLMRVDLSANKCQVYLRGFLTNIKLNRIEIEKVEIDVDRINKKIELRLYSYRHVLLSISFRNSKDMNRKLEVLRRFFPSVEPMLEDDFLLLKPIEEEPFE